MHTTIIVQQFLVKERLVSCHMQLAMHTREQKWGQVKHLINKWVEKKDAAQRMKSNNKNYHIYCFGTAKLPSLFQMLYSLYTMQLSDILPPDGGRYGLQILHLVCGSIILCFAMRAHWRENVIKPGLHRDANATFENDVNVRFRCVTKVRQTAFECAINIGQTAECYPSTVGTSKGICIQYVYVGSIRCLGECWTVYKCIIHSASALVYMYHSHSCFIRMQM